MYLCLFKSDKNCSSIMYLELRIPSLPSPEKQSVPEMGLALCNLSLVSSILSKGILKVEFHGRFDIFMVISPHDVHMFVLV